MNLYVVALPPPSLSELPLLQGLKPMDDEAKLLYEKSNLIQIHSALHPPPHPSIPLLSMLNLRNPVSLLMG